MSFWSSVNGTVRVELTSADPAHAMQQLADAGITVFRAERAEDDIVTAFTVRRQELPKVEKIAEAKGYALRLAGRSGIFWAALGLVHRPVLVVGVLALFVLSAWLPGRVLFVQVEGNSSVPSRLIAEKCAECGLYFGAERKQVRSEKVKNALLEAIPELQWAGVNTAGCVATVTVRERTDEESGMATSGVSSIVAARDGLITSCTVTRGSVQCRVGQVVKAGNLLVSGYTDCGFSIRAERAEAEIYAQTQRSVTVFTPSGWEYDAETGGTEKKYSLIIGKKRINFFKGSGISGTSCDKIYSEYYFTLPGGFVLPAALVTEQCTAVTQVTVQTQEDDAQAMLSRLSSGYLLTQMNAGRILSASERFGAGEGIFTLDAVYACSEMIAQVRNEEIIKPYGTDN